MADYNSKYSGEQVEALLDQVANGEVGGDTLTETEIAEMGFTKNEGTITEVKMNGVSKGASGVVDLGTVITEHQDISGKVDKVIGKGLSTEDFTTALKVKLEGLTNYDDTAINEAVGGLQQSLNTLLNSNPNEAINSFNEIIAFLDGIKDTSDLSGIIASIEQQIAGKMDKITLASVATSGSYNDLTDKPTIPSAVTESTVSGWGFTKNTGTYSKPSGGIPASDLAEDVFLQGPKGEDGEDGVGITSVRQTTTSSSDGGSNVVTVTLTDGTTSTFTVKNGSKGSAGSNGTNGTNGKDGADGEDGVTFTPSVDAAGNLSWSNNKGLANPPTVNIKGPKGDAGSGGGTITEIKANGTSIATSGVANIPAATTSAYGVTKLTSSTSSTSTTLAATASAVKSAYDLANSYKGTVTGVKINGATKSPSSGTVDIGNVVTSIKINGSTKTPSSGVVDLGTISGGGGSSSGAYPEIDGSIYDSGMLGNWYTVNELMPNTFYVFPECGVLDITAFGPETAGVANEYLFQFTSGSTPTTLSLPNDIKWANDSAPSISADKIYQISILKGLGSVLEFDNAAQLLSFMANNKTYSAEVGMSWRQFVDSIYNLSTNGLGLPDFSISYDEVTFMTGSGMSGTVQLNNANVLPDSLIIENAQYDIIINSGVFD